MSLRLSLRQTPANTAKTAFLAALLATSAFGAAQAGAKLGWVWASDPTNPGPYVPDTSYSYNSSGGGVSITRNSAGLYVVTFSGLKSVTPSNVLVSAYSTSGYCQSGGWSSSGPDENMTVLCFDRLGAPADSYFTLVYQAHSGTFGSGAKGMAYLWADNPTSPSYNPSSSYSYNSTGGTNSITRNGVGSYTAQLPGLTTIGGTVQVTAYGSTAARCKTSGWSQTAGGTFVDVLCFDNTGAPVDQRFTLAYARNQAIGFYSNTATHGVYAWANHAKSASYIPSRTYRFNSIGAGGIHASRSGKGVYIVTFNGGGYTSSNMLVTAYGSDSSYCNVIGWGPLETACYSQGGHPKDTLYDVAFQITPP